MSSATRGAGPRTALAAARIGQSARAECIPVEGSLPEGLEGCYLQAGLNPAGRSGVGPHHFQGIRLSEGTARWHRSEAAVRRSEPLGPIPPLAPVVWLSDSAAADASWPTTFARPIREASSAQWHTVAAYPGLGYAEHLVTTPDGAVVHAEPFAIDGAPLMRSVAITGRFLVVLDLPLVYSQAAALVGVRLPYAWRVDRPARIGLLARDGAEPRWYRVAPCFIPDVVNAYEDGENVVLDGLRQSRPMFPAPAPAFRWTFDLTSGTARVRPLVGVPRMEEIFVDARVGGRRHRYIFGCDGGTGLFCHDLARGATSSGRLGADWRADRPVFAPDPADGREGAGWLVFVARHVSGKRSELRVVEALDPGAAPRAVVRLPTPMPTAWRATWMESAR